MNDQETKSERALINAYGTGETLSPLVHSEEVLSNRALARRMSIKSGNAIVSVPVLSGNSFRGMWRDLAALHIMETLKVKQVSQDLFGIFFGGGSLSKGKVTKEFRDKLYNTFPSLRVFGFSIGNVMYPSKLAVDFGVPQVKETQEYSKALYPKLSLTATETLANDITNMTMMTLKKDDDKAIVAGFELVQVSFPMENSKKEEEDDEEEIKRGKSQMIYHVEYIVPNTHFVHGFRALYPMQPLEIGALLKAVMLGGTRSFGGMGGRGFGRMQWSYKLEMIARPGDEDSSPKSLKMGNVNSTDETLKEYITQYETHLSNMQSTIKSDADLKTHLVLE